jgi:hypothetical protein
MTNKKVMEAIKMKSSTFYALKKRNPRLVDLLKKGLLYEDLKNEK